MSVTGDNLASPRARGLLARARDRAASRIVGLDGVRRTEEQEAQLNRLALAAFGGGEGAEFLAYLKSITVNLVLGPHATDAELRQHEGQRYVVALIDGRMEHGRRQLSGPSVGSIGGGLGGGIGGVGAG